MRFVSIGCILQATSTSAHGRQRDASVALNVLYGIEVCFDNNTKYVNTLYAKNNSLQ
jgi:hypothetical protein